RHRLAQGPMHVSRQEKPRLLPAKGTLLAGDLRWYPPSGGPSILRKDHRDRLDREEIVKTKLFAALLLASALTATGASAQPAPFNGTGVTMGHWHLISKDIEANKKFFLAMGGKLYMPGGTPLMMFPGLYINLNLGMEQGEGGTVGSVVNHLGFIVDDVQKRRAEWKAKGVKVLPGNNGRKDQAYVETP